MPIHSWKDLDTFYQQSNAHISPPQGGAGVGLQHIMKISVIGAGAMGGAIVQGLLKGDFAKNSDITVADPSQKAIDQFAESGASITTDNNIAAESSDIVNVVVKPWLVEPVLKGIKSSLNYKKQILVVVAAGVSSEQIKEWLQKDGEDMIPFFLVIPNIAIALLSSMTFIVPANASRENTKLISEMYGSMGEVMIVDEKHLAAGTTLASCGIAYAMRYVRAASEGGVEIGFKAEDAKNIVLQTVKGAVELLQTTGNHPEAEIDKVTTPGGVTIRGLNEMEHAGFTSAVIRGLKAAL